MKFFRWKGITQSGLIKQGSSYAPSLQELEKTLLADHIALTSASHYPIIFSVRPSPAALALMWQQLWLLLSQGILIDQALRIASRQTTNPLLKSTLIAVHTDVIAGATLSQAAQKYPLVFDPLTIAMLSAGIRGGSLAESCQRIFQFKQQHAETRRTLIQAAAGPLITLAVSLALTLLLLAAVVPQFITLFASLEKPIPQSTAFIIALHQALFSWSGLLITLLMVVMGIFFVRLAKNHATIQERAHLLILQIPILGSCIAAYNMLAFLQTLALLCQGGTLLREAFILAIEAIGNKTLAKVLAPIPQQLEQGAPLTLAIEQLPEMPILQPLKAALGSAIAGGNELSAGLTIATKLYEQQLKTQFNLIRVILQPLILLAVASILFFILISLYLPLFNLANIG